MIYGADISISAYFQGLLYIFCFRWRDLIDQDMLPPSLDWDDPASFIGQDLPWMTGLKTRLQANIGSKFNVSFYSCLLSWA